MVCGVGGLRRQVCRVGTLDRWAQDALHARGSPCERPHGVCVSSVPLARQVPQAGSERPQSTGGALGPCVPTPLLLEALCDLLQMH